MSRVVLGTDVETGQEVRLGDIERRSGLYLLGRMGMGKSALAVNIALHDIDHGHGLFFLDPHGDAVIDLLRRGDAQKLKKGAYLLDPQDESYSFGINLLQCANVKSLTARMDTYTRAYNVFQKIWEEEWGVWLQLILQNVLHAFIENQGYTLADVPMFLNPRNVEFRNHIIDNIQYEPQVADFWRYEFFDSKRGEQRQQERVDAALTRINTLLTHRYVRDIVGQAKTTIDFANLLSQNKIILLKLSANLPEDVKKFIGTILLNELVFALRDRPEDKRTQFCVFIDEFHNFASTDHMAVMTTEGRKFGVAATYLHVERFGQLAHNQKLMGATQAIVNKGLFQSTVNDAEEFAPEFAKRVEPTEIRREAELVLSPNPVEDIWDRRHPSEYIMWLRGRFFWIVELLRNKPNEKYFAFDFAFSSPEFRRKNPAFQVKKYPDWQYYCSSVDMIRQGISLWNQFLFDWMRGKYDPNEYITDEQVEITIKMIECLGGVLGFLPMMRPYIPNEKRERLLYLMNEKRKQQYEEDKRVKIQTARTEMQYLKEHPVEINIPHHLSKSRVHYYKSRTIAHRDKAKINYNTVEWELAEELGFHKKQEEQSQRIENLWNQIQRLEYSQPSQYTSLPSSITSLKNLDEIKTVAIQAGMASHELEELIEWELHPFTSSEKEALMKCIKFEAKMVNHAIKYDDAKHNERRDLIDDFLTVSVDRQYICEFPWETRHPRMVWQIQELDTFINSVLGVEPRILAQDPIKIPSGKYVETLRVERTQQDLNNERAQELVNLPRFQAYTKVIDESRNTQIVRTHKMQTHPLPAIQSMETEKYALANGHTAGKEREEIETEIRQRQNRWQRGSGSPRTRERE